MKLALKVLLIVLICTSFGNAEDIHLKNGHVYRNVLIFVRTEYVAKFWFNNETLELAGSEILKIDSTKAYDKNSASYVGSTDPREDYSLGKKAEAEASPLRYDLSYFGYAGNIPEVPFGFTFGVSYFEKIGWYLSLKLSANPVSDNEYYGDISINKAENIFHDKRTGTKGQYFEFTLGINKRIINPVFIFCGLGYSHWSEYLNYRDEFEILGKNGSYYIDGGENTAINLNFGAGFIMQNGWYLSIGGNTAPGGVDLGIGKMFDRWF